MKRKVTENSLIGLVSPPTSASKLQPFSKLPFKTLVSGVDQLLQSLYNQKSSFPLSYDNKFRRVKTFFGEGGHKIRPTLYKIERDCTSLGDSDNATGYLSAADAAQIVLRPWMWTEKPSVETTVLYLNAHKAAVIAEQRAVLGGIW